AATDLVGNPSAAVGPVKVADGINPRVTIGPLNQPFNSVNDTLTVTFSFSEPVTGFDASDVTVGGPSGGRVLTFTQDAADHYTATIGGFTRRGDVTVFVPRGA